MTTAGKREIATILSKEIQVAHKQFVNCKELYYKAKNSKADESEVKHYESLTDIAFGKKLALEKAIIALGIDWRRDPKTNGYIVYID